MLTAAVIGCGRMGAEPSSRLLGSVPSGWLPISHVECLRRIDTVRLIGLADIDQARLKHCGALYNVAALYTDCRQLLEQLRPDVVSIATRTPEKANIIQSACQFSAKAIYVEKPLANSLAVCREILSVAERAKTLLGYGVNRRYHAVYRQARALLQNNEIGEVIEVVLEFGAAPLLWTHPHSVDLALFLLGSTDVIDAQARLHTDSVNIVSDTVVDSDPVVEHAHFTMSSGAGVIITRGNGCNVRICGSRGTLTVHADGHCIQINRPHNSQKGYFIDQSLLYDFPAMSATEVAFSELVNAINGTAVLAITPREIEVGLQMLLACVWSHLNAASVVRMVDVPDSLTVTGCLNGRYA